MREAVRVRDIVIGHDGLFMGEELEMLLSWLQTSLLLFEQVHGVGDFPF